MILRNGAELSIQFAINAFGKRSYTFLKEINKKKSDPWRDRFEKAELLTIHMVEEGFILGETTMMYEDKLSEKLTIQQFKNSSVDKFYIELDEQIRRDLELIATSDKYLNATMKNKAEKMLRSIRVGLREEFSN